MQPEVPPDGGRFGATLAKMNRVAQEDEMEEEKVASCLQRKWDFGGAPEALAPLLLGGAMGSWQWDCHEDGAEFCMLTWDFAESLAEGAIFFSFLPDSGFSQMGFFALSWLSSHL